ncbi:MAG: BspA family leucine-rich repeat surface protein, partial [Cyclobacteriaceae bacterium]
IDGSTNAIIQGNRIGTSANGLAADGNQAYGIQARFADNILIGGNSLAGEGNLISGNGIANHYAIHLRDGINAQVFGNLIGTDANGDNDLGNRGGITVTSGCDNPTIGGTGAGQANVVVGCTQNPAISVNAQAAAANQNVVIENNIVGLNAAGTTAIPNASQGISLRSVSGITSGNIIRGNTVAASGSTGLEVIGFSQTNLIIENNKIGTDINGNGGAVFGINSAGMSFNNVIGTDNSTNRVQILDNVIANAALNGLSLGSLENALIQRNYIGVEPDGITPGPNTGAGILTTSGSINLEIGGIGNENIIAHNTGDGINFQSLAQTTAGTIIGVNSYFCNGDVAIDFTMTPAVDAPVITAVSATDVDGTSTASIGSSVDIYTIDAGCADNQGANYVGQATVAAGGLWNFSGVIDDTQTYVATVTDVTNGISEFSASFAPNTSFITTWSTTDNQITIPTTGAGYNYDIVWTNLTSAGIGDGSTTGATGNFTIPGLTNGHVYQVEISGAFPQIIFNNGGDRLKIQTIEQWGDIVWTSMNSAFEGCTNLTSNAADAPDLSLVTDLSEMFRGASAFNSDVSGWDVSGVELINFIFGGASAFNNGETTNTGANPLNWANTSSFQYIALAFQTATAFNQDISTWDVSGVLEMSSMFQGATDFNNGGQTLDWSNTGLVENMSYMFTGATAFNVGMPNWDVSSVTNFFNMFGGAILFNQDLNWTINTSQPVTMESMFNGAAAFNGDISAWNVSQVVDFSSMFNGASLFNQPINTWVLNTTPG